MSIYIRDNLEVAIQKLRKALHAARKGTRARRTRSSDHDHPPAEMVLMIYRHGTLAGYVLPSRGHGWVAYTTQAVGFRTYEELAAFLAAPGTTARVATGWSKGDLL